MMATVHRNWLRDDAPEEVRAERTRKALIASHIHTPDRYQRAVRETQTRSAEAVTAFVNAGPNWWLDERQAWLDARIADETRRGGSAFGDNGSGGPQS